MGAHGAARWCDKRSVAAGRRASSKLAPGFTCCYKVDKLVYFDELNDINAAITREEQIKAGSRRRKVALIDTMDPICFSSYLTEIASSHCSSQ
jgi:predicted GIY-YIG superfamily endonuclease